MEWTSLNDLREQFQNIAGCEITVNAIDMTAMMGGSDISVDITGDDYATLSMIAGDLAGQIARLEDAVDVTTSVAVSGGLYPLCSVRLSAPIPLSRLTEAVDLLHGLTVTAPVAMGQVLLEDLLGLGVQVLSTRSVPALQIRRD